MNSIYNRKNTAILDIILKPVEVGKKSEKSLCALPQCSDVFGRLVGGLALLETFIKTYDPFSWSNYYNDINGWRKFCNLQQSYFVIFIH